MSVTDRQADRHTDILAGSPQRPENVRGTQINIVYWVKESDKNKGLFPNSTLPLCTGARGGQAGPLDGGEKGAPGRPGGGGPGTGPTTGQLVNTSTPEVAEC